MSGRTRGLLGAALAIVVVALLVLRSLDEKHAESGAIAPGAPIAPGATEAAPEPARSSELAAAEARPAPREEAAVPSAEARETAEPAPEAGAAPRDVVEPLLELAGRVVDLDGAPLAGVGVVWRSEPAVELARTDPSGLFRIEIEHRAAPRELTVGDASLAAVRTSMVLPTNLEREHLVVAEPAVDLAGTVVDTGGAPVAKAEVRVRFPQSLFAGFPLLLETTRTQHRQARTTADGSFALERVPSDARLSLEVSGRGYVTATSEVPDRSALDLLLELVSAEAGERREVRGVVLHADRRPASAAIVRLGVTRATADEQGRFSLPCDNAGPEDSLIAVVQGFQPALLPRFNEPWFATRDVPPPVELVLGPAALAIDGEVLDAVGEPCAGWVVALLDGTVAVRGQVPLDLVEDLARGSSETTRTDADGRFRLEGLSAREYTLRAYDPDTLAQIRSEPVAAGTRVTLRVPEGILRERVAGRIVSRTGLPVEGARVTIGMVSAQSGGAMMWENGSSAVSDAAGRFELTRVPRSECFVTVEGDAVIPARHELDPDPVDSGLVLEVARRCRFRVADEGAEPADFIQVLDDAGEALSVFVIQPNGYSTSNRVKLTDGASAPLAVSEDARTLVFLRDDVEVARVPVRLDPDEPAVLRR